MCSCDHDCGCDDNHAPDDLLPFPYPGVCRPGWPPVIVTPPPRPYWPTGGYADCPPPARPHFEPSPTCPPGLVCTRPINRCVVSCKPFYNPQTDQWGKSCTERCPDGTVRAYVQYGNDPANPWG